MPYGIWHHNGGFQTKDQAGGRRPHGQSTGYYYICQHSFKRDTYNSLMIAAHNDLEVKVGNIMEKVMTTLGSEFGKDAGKTAVIARASYGIKPAGKLSC